MSTSDQGPIEPAMPKKYSKFFAAVRARGILNAMLDGPVKAFEEANEGFRCRWEYAPPSGDNTLIVAREGMGFRIVDASELGDLTDSQQKDGPVRCGDLVLMAAPEEIVNMVEYEDAKAAFEDFKLPETTYRKHLETIQVRTKSGELVSPAPTGRIRMTTEAVGAREPQHELETGG